MSESVNDGDSVYMLLTGRGKADGKIFTTTDAEIAKKSDVYDKNTRYGPLFVTIGKGGLLMGLERRLVGLNIGETHKITVPSSEGFGRRDPNKIEGVPLRR